MLATFALVTWSLLTSPVTEANPDSTCNDWIESRSWESHSTPETRILSDRVACYDGTIESGSLDELHRWIDLPGVSGRRRVLVVRSRGGDADVALDLAEKLQAADAEVFVVDVCASSCANYFYAGVRRRHAVGSPLILYHGGFSEPSRQRVAEALDKFLSGPDAASVPNHDAVRRGTLLKFDSSMARQDALYSRIGVSADVVHGVDVLDVPSIENERCGGASDLPRNFIYFDRAQMERLNILPISGDPEVVPMMVNDANASVDGTFIACLAPTNFGMN